jgi:hypothetical protein
MSLEESSHKYEIIGHESSKCYRSCILTSIQNTKSQKLYLLTKNKEKKQIKSKMLVYVFEHWVTF